MVTVAAKELRECQHCGRTFAAGLRYPEKVRNRFCSPACRIAGVSRERSLGTEERTCGDCGGRFPARIALLRGGKYKGQFCSNECADRARRRREPLTCATCGKHFERTPSEIAAGSTRFCSLTCWYASENDPARSRPHNVPRRLPPLIFACSHCGTSYEVSRRKTTQAMKARRHFCSRGCLDAYMRTHPEETANWIDGRSAFPYGPGWNQSLKHRIVARDQSRCQLCGCVVIGVRSGAGRRKSNVHHIDRDKKNCKPANLATLCSTCHGMVHAHRSRYHWQLYLSLCMATRIAGLLPAPSPTEAIM